MRNCIPEGIRVPAVLLAIVGIAATGECSATQHRDYVNEEFGISLQIAQEAPICTTPPGQRDYGITIFLDSGPNGCDSLDARPYVSVIGFYNAGEDESPVAALSDICSSLGGKQVDAPVGLEISRRPSASCRSDSSDKHWTDLYVSTQSESTGRIAGINYFAHLHTTSERFDAELVRFRAFLGSIRISEPVPSTPRR